VSEKASGVVLVARTGSTRLPGKSLLDVCGRPVLAHQIERVKMSRRPCRFILATTDLPADEALCAIARSAGIDTFCGAASDVLRRLGDTAAAYKLDFMAVIGGDDVFCEGEFVDAVIAHYEETGADFITMQSVPFGTSPFGLSVAALTRVLSMRADDASDGWERFFTDTGLFRTATLRPSDAALFHPNIRLDLDYPEDYEQLKIIYERLYDGTVPSLRRVLHLLTTEPALAAINRSAHEKYMENRTTAWPPLRLKSTS
jgi:spore coat polysaccharide biosynthesis protein SpsF